MFRGSMGGGWDNSDKLDWVLLVLIGGGSWITETGVRWSDIEWFSETDVRWSDIEDVFSFVYSLNMIFKRLMLW